MSPNVVLRALHIIGVLLAACTAQPVDFDQARHKNIAFIGDPSASQDTINFETLSYLNLSVNMERSRQQLCHTQSPSVLKVIWITVATWRNVARLHLCLASILSQQPPTAPHGMAVKILVNEDHSEDMLSAAERLAYQAKGDFIFTTTQDCTPLSPGQQPGTVAYILEFIWFQSRVYVSALTTSF